MRRLLISVLVLAAALPAAGQALTTVTGTIVDPNGIPYSNAAVNVQLAPVPPGQAKCGNNPLPAAGPFQTDVNGSFTTVLCPNSNITPGSTTWNFNISISPGVPPPLGFGGQAFSVSITVGTSSPQNVSSTINALAPALSRTGTGSGGCSPLGNNGDLQAKNGSACAATGENDNGSVLNIGRDVIFQGPNPYVDLRRFNVRATSGAVAQAVASINSGSAVPTLSSVSTFQNGDGVVIPNAGATNTMSTPAAPTVTPSILIGPANVGLETASAACATTYHYKIIAEDVAGGFTAASPAGSTTTGCALGPQTNTISTLTRSNLTVTATTTAAHNLAAGAYVFIAGTGDDNNYGGWFTIASVPSGTTFTYLTALDTRNGTNPSTTGGTVFHWTDNFVSWPAVTSAWQYYIYSDRAVPGTFALVGISEPSSLFSGIQRLNWEDFGSPIMDGVSAPFYIPTTAPSSATNDWLSTTIISGAGTLTPTLAATASNTSGTSVMLFDNGPNLLAAANSTTSALLFPATSGSYVISARVFLPQGVVIRQAGAVTLNGTVSLGAGASQWYGDLDPQSWAITSFGKKPQAPIVVGTANPGIYASMGKAINIHDLILSASGNNARLMLLDPLNVSTPIPAFQMQDMSFMTIGPADFTGMHLIGRGTAANGLSVNTCTNCLFSSGPNQGVTVPVPTVALSSGQTNMDGLIINRRGLAWLNTLNIGGFGVHTGYFSGGNQPMITFYPYPGLTGGGFTFTGENILSDTSANPYFTVLNGMSVVGILTGLGTTSSNQPVVSGTGFASISGPTSGQNTNVINGPDFESTNVKVNGIGEFYYPLTTPAAPTLATSGGIGPPANTYFYATVPVDVNGKQGSIGATSASITVNGSQGVLVTFAAPINGQVATTVCRAINANFGGGVCATVGVGFQIGGTSFLDDGTFFPNQPANQVNTGAAATSISILGLNAVTLNIVGTGFVNSLSGNFTAHRFTSYPDASGTVGLAVLGSLTTTAATTDNVTLTGMTASGHCQLTATNTSAATNVATTFVSNKTTNQITVTHTAISGMTYDVSCSPN